MIPSKTQYHTVLYTTLALLAFAGNSVLCRLALSGEHGDTVDAISFTVIRLLSGIAMLLLLVKLGNKKKQHSPVYPKNLDSEGRGFHLKYSVSALWLFIYMAGFSFAYIYLDTGVGALILFGSVQITMIISGLLTGNKLHITEWLGVIFAFFGFVYLIFPSLTEPSLVGFILMVLAGIAWGLYTLRGKGSTKPLVDTMQNFANTLPLIILLLFGYVFLSPELSVYGVILAILSGTMASAIGYAIWYSALSGLSGIQAAVVQLLVPIIAAVGGVIWAHEAISLRLLISSLIVLGGLLLVIFGRYYFSNKS